jgi:predicted GIY-YIG superfamily endonuclease
MAKEGFSGFSGRSPPPPMFYVYILKCKDNELYTGCTDDLKDRINRHQKGGIPATKDRLPLKLASYFAFLNKYKAYEFEKYLKTGSGRAFTNRHLF